MSKEHLVHCTVSDCIYNDTEYCKSGSIKVDGDDASQYIQTCCDTFTNKKNIITNFTSSINNTSSTKIKCKAVDCTHNEDKLCNLDSIDVDCTCNPINCSSTSETCCTSFECL